MAKCQGKTKAGTPCTRNATQGQHCKSHLPALDEGKGKDSCATRISEFTDIVDYCLKKLEKATLEGVQVQWMRLVFDSVKAAKEEQRLLDGHGIGVQYVCNNYPPEGDRPIPPPDDGTPPESASEDDGRVLN